jgi:T-complex protein 1 subunit delta
LFNCVDLRALIAGGGAPETECSLRLSEHAQSVTGVDSYCFKAYADALEIIPLTLAENAGLNSIATVTELRNRHAQGEITAGINVRKVRYSCLIFSTITNFSNQGTVSNILEEEVVQPLLVSVSAINLATETVRSILKIDDIVNTMQ